MKLQTQKQLKAKYQGMMITNDFTVSYEIQNQNQLVIIIEGQVRHMYCMELKRYLLAVMDESPGSIALDLSDLNFIASPFIAIMIEMMKQSNNTQQQMILRNPNEQVWGLIEISKLQFLFDRED